MAVAALGMLMVATAPLLLPAGNGRARAAAAAVPPNSVTGFGQAVAAGPDGSAKFNGALVGMARAGAPGQAGYWVAADDGGVFAYGSAPFHGSLGGQRLVKPVVGIASAGTGNGYWLAASDGGVFSFGGAPFLGSAAGLKLAAPVVGIARNPSGDGYWLVAADGGVLNYGAAGFFGSRAGQALSAPVVGIAATPTGAGYWLAAEDGGVFAFGDAKFLGAADAGALPAPIAGIAAAPDGSGYWLAGRDGQIYAFGSPDLGSAVDNGPVDGAVVGIAAQSADGYWLLHGDPLVTKEGESGVEVEQVQRRLTDLGYWLGPITGRYDNLTRHAVYAFQKVEALPLTGTVEPEVRRRLFAAERPKPQSPAGNLIEIDKGRQVLFVVRGGQVAFAFNTSTGTEKDYTYKGTTRRADTPPGRFVVTWEYDGTRESFLGRLYRPKYFHSSGLAIHGYSFVPPYPASHGCVRVSRQAMDFAWTQNLIPIGAQVWIYGTSPPTPAR